MTPHPDVAPPSPAVPACLQALRTDPDALPRLLRLLPPAPPNLALDGAGLLAWLQNADARPDVEAACLRHLLATCEAVGGNLVRWTGDQWATRAASGRGLRTFAAWWWETDWADRLTRPWIAPPDAQESLRPELTAACLAPVFASLRSTLERAEPAIHAAQEAARDEWVDGLRVVLDDSEVVLSSAREFIRDILLSEPLTWLEWLLYAPEAKAVRTAIGGAAKRRGWGWRWRDVAAELPGVIRRLREQAARGLRVVRGGAGTGGGTTESSGPEAGAETGPRTLATAWPWPGLPDEATAVRVPAAIQYQVDRTIWVERDADGLEPDKQRPIANGPVALIGRLEDADTGEVFVHLAWLQPDGTTFTHTLPRAVLAARTSPDEGINLGMPVPLDGWPRLARALAEMEALNLRHGTLPLRTRLGRTGWSPPRAPGDAVEFVLPQTVITAPGRRPRTVITLRNAPAAAHYHAEGTVTAEAQMVAGVLSCFPKLAWSLGHAMAAACIRWWSDQGLLEFKGYAVEYLESQTGKGKTFGAAFGLMPWGTAHDMMTPFDGTSYGTIEQIHQLSDLPVGFHEGQADGQRGSMTPTQVIHALADGGGRIQGRKEGGLRPRRVLHGVVLFANNQSIVGGERAQQGASVRVLSAGSLIPLLNNPAVIERMEQGFREDYGHGGPATIQRLLTETDGNLTALRHRLAAEWTAARAAIQAALAPVYETLPREARVQLRRTEKPMTAGLAGLRLLLDTYAASDGVDPDDVTTMRQYGEPGYLEVVRQIATDWPLTHQPEWQTALEILAARVMEHSFRFAGMERRDPRTNAAVPPSNGYVGGWVRVAEEPATPCLAVNPEWARDQILDGLTQRKELSSIIKTWIAEGVLIPAASSHRPTRIVRIRHAGGGSATPRCYVLRPRLADGWEWITPITESSHDDEQTHGIPETLDDLEDF